MTSVVVPVETDLGTVEAEILEPIITLARQLLRARDVDVATAALREADVQLDAWEQPRRLSKGVHEIAWLPFGVEVRLPAGFEPG
jgi:hypothetical protein